jgi:N-acetylmuramoyl-L-alanine amidase
MHPDLRRRRLLRSSALLLGVGAGLTHLPADAGALGEELAATTGYVHAPPPVDEIPPFVKPRETWGAAAPVQPYVPHTPTTVSLHHTGTVWHGRPPVEQYLRNIQAFHTGPEREWEDVAYHYLIDLEGGVWAGRPPTVRGNPSVYYDSMGYVLICLLGDYSVQEPSEAQLEAVAGTAAWLIRRFKLAAGAIDAHRDHAPTACPGDNIYRLVQDHTIAGQVRARLA